jgi:hypothetical protein
MRKLYEQKYIKTAKRIGKIRSLDMEKSPGRGAVKPFQSHEKTLRKSPHDPGRVLNPVKVKKLIIKSTEIKIKIDRLSLGLNLVQTQRCLKTLAGPFNDRISSPKAKVITLKEEG